MFDIIKKIIKIYFHKIRNLLFRTILKTNLLAGF